MKALALVALATLAGCTTVRPIDTAPVLPPERTPPAEAMVACQQPEPMEDNSFGSVVRKLTEALGLLEQCSSKQKELKEFLER